MVQLVKVPSHTYSLLQLKIPMSVCLLILRVLTAGEEKKIVRHTNSRPNELKVVQTDCPRVIPSLGLN